MSHHKADRYYRPDGVTVRKLAQDSNRIAEMLRKKRQAVPAPVNIKEPKK